MAQDLEGEEMRDAHTAVRSSRELAPSLTLTIGALKEPIG
jgi:hypothetical protein